MPSSITQPDFGPSSHTGPEPLTRAYLREVQERVIETRCGPWDLHTTDDGSAFGFGPFSFVEPWDDTELLPAIDFCHNARADVPALLGEVARLQTRLALLEEQCARLMRAATPAAAGGRDVH